MREKIIKYIIHLINKIFKKKHPKETIKSFGLEKDKRDKRDYKYTRTIQRALPRSYYIPKLPPIRNQGRIGSCASHALVGAYEIILLNHKPKEFIEGSELFHYYNARKYINHTFPQDKGMTLRDACKTMHKFGNAPELTWRYRIDKYNTEPNKIAYWFANLYKIKEYQRVYDIADIKHSLLDNVPVIFGIQLYDSYFKLDEVNRVYYPKGEYRGGHAQLIVGYDEDTQRFKVRNSWGEDWGLKGYYYLPYEVFKKYTFDYWVIKILK